MELSSVILGDFMNTPLLHWSGKNLPVNYRLLIDQALRPFVSKTFLTCSSMSINYLLTDRNGAELEMRFITKVSGVDGICTTGTLHEQQGPVLALALVALANVLPIEIATESGDVIEEKSLLRVHKQLLSPVYTQDVIEQLLEELGFLVTFKSAVRSTEASLFF
jgi:hypothetical protein